MKKLLAMLLTLVLALSATTISWAEVTSEKAFPEGGGEGNVVYWSVGKEDNEHGFTTTLAAALTAAYKANKSAITIICKPDADVGSMTHGHVADDLTIYGNGAKVSGGERDLEVDMFKYSRTTGATADDGASLEKDITITVYDLDGVAIWGNRNTAYKVTASFYNCKNMNRAYITGKSGSNVLLFDGCSFDGSQGNSNAICNIYSNAEGSVTVKDTTFTGVAVPINLKNKSNGTQTVSVENCTFTDCATESVAGAAGASQYAAPIRVVADNENAKTELTVSGCEFNYASDAKSVNGDILIGDGRANEKPVNANVTISVKNTAAVVETQEGDYYNGQGEKNVTKSTSQTVSTGDAVTGTGASLTVAPAQTEQPPRYYYNSTTTTDTKAGGTKGSPKTFDAGMGVYALTAVLSATGMAYVGKKKF